MMIYLKLILATILAAIPFIYASYVRPKEKTLSTRRCFLTAIGTKLPLLRTMTSAPGRFLNRLYEGMKKSDSFRKFFSLVTLILTIAVQFVDFSASTDIAGIIQSQQTDSVETTRVITIYGPIMTRPHATIVAACLSMTLFWYKAADLILTSLHNRRRLFLGTALTALVFLFVSPRFVIITETLEMLLMAAIIYPKRIPLQEPKGRKPLPTVDRRGVMRKAA